jgi:hypothetical protein
MIRINYGWARKVRQSCFAQALQHANSVMLKPDSTSQRCRSGDGQYSYASDLYRAGHAAILTIPGDVGNGWLADVARG